MTIEEIKALGLDELETRASSIAKEVKEADADKAEELKKELDAIEERKNAIKIENEETRKKAAEVANGAGKTVETRKDENKMTNKEVRNSQEYVEAFAKYIKTGKDAECRSLLTENVEGGTVPVPELVENRVRQAWENDEIFSRIDKTYVKGNLKVGFEISATDASVHTEGDKTKPDEEVLTLGIVNMVPSMIKKWITVSDEVLSLGAEDFLAYIYDELTYKIIQKAASLVVDAIMNAPVTSDTEHVGVAKIVGDVEPTKILEAIAELGDGAQNKVFIASGQTIASVREYVIAEGQYAYDPFFGLTVIQKEGVTGAIVGDLSGVQANLPDGDAVTFKFDDLSMAEHDLVKIVGKLYAAIAVVGPKMFATIKAE